VLDGQPEEVAISDLHATVLNLNYAVQGLNTGIQRIDDDKLVPDTYWGLTP
jgi:hypothetical protein